LNEKTNTDQIQQAYRNVQAGDIPSLLNTLTEDVVWQLPEMTNVPFAGTWRGRQKVAEFFRIVHEVQDVVDFQPEEFIAHRDKVVVLGHFTMLVKATGKESHSAWVHVWTIENGSVTSVREYVDSLAVSRAHTRG
jgi:ketosteroid isomerase-like protein